MPVPSRGRFWGVGAASALLWVGAAHASVTYHYESPIDYWADSGGRGSFALFAGLTDWKLSLDLTLANPLGAGLGVPVGPVWHAVDAGDILSWTYHGGGPALSLGSNIGGTLSLFVVTDASGNISNSTFTVNGAVTIPNLAAPDAQGRTSYSSWLSQYHAAYYDQQLLTSDFTRVFGYNLYGQPYLGSLSERIATPQFGGVWSMTTNSEPAAMVPEPETYALLLAGLGALGLISRRQRAASHAD